MKVLVAVPTFEHVETDTFSSIYSLDTSGHCVQLTFVKGYGAARARNLIADIAVEGNHDAVLMVDSDMVIPQNALKILATTGADVSLGVYPRKGEPDRVELFRVGERDFTDRNRFSIGDIPHGPFEVKGGGFGCAFVKTSVFERMARPWFRYVEYESGAVLSEDVSFCLRAREAGLKTVADGRVMCGHIGKSTTWPAVG